MNFRIIVRFIIIIILFNTIIFCENQINKYSHFKLGLLQYEPGDWNSDQTALTELLKFINQNTNTFLFFVDFFYKIFNRFKISYICLKSQAFRL